MQKRSNRPVILISVIAAVIIIAAAIFAVNRVQKAKAIKAELEEAQALMQENETLLKKHLEDCGKRAEKREADFGMALKQREGADERIREQVRELSVVCLGDSIMLGAVPALFS